MRQGVCKAATATSSPHVVPRHVYSYGGQTESAARGKIGWRMGNYVWLAIKDILLPKKFRKCHINVSRYLNMVLGMHVILPSSVQIFIADELKNTRGIESFSIWHKVDMLK